MQIIGFLLVLPADFSCLWTWAYSPQVMSLWQICKELWLF